jgi:hypothetical protein
MTVNETHYSDVIMDPKEAVLQSNKTAAFYFLGVALAIQGEDIPAYRQLSGSQGQGFRYAAMRAFFNRFPDSQPSYRKLGSTPEMALYGSAWATTASSDRRRQLALLRKLIDIRQIPGPEIMDTWVLPNSALTGKVWARDVGFSGSAFISNLELEALKELYKDAHDAWNTWVATRDDPRASRSDLLRFYREISPRWKVANMEINSIIGARANALKNLSKADLKRTKDTGVRSRIALLKRDVWYQAYNPLRIIGIKSSYSDEQREESEEDCIQRNVDNLKIILRRSAVSDLIQGIISDAILSFGSDILSHDDY